MQYSPATQQLSLLNSAGAVVGSGPIGKPGSGSDLVLSGTQCSVDVTASSATEAGTTLSLFLSFKFKTAASYGWYGRAQALAPPNTVTEPISASLGSLSVTGTIAPVSARGMPQSPPAYYALNNGTQETWNYCVLYPYTTDCYVNSPMGSAAALSNCQGDTTGLSVVKLTYPSVLNDADPSYFDLTWAASSLVLPGWHGFTCSSSNAPGGTITGSNTIQVFDATPLIGAIQPTDPDDNGAFYIQIYGTNFGPSVGSVSVCAVSNGSCSDFTISYQGQAQYAVWSDQQVNVLLTPTATATGGVYNVQLTSVGESGTGFVALQNKSQPQSNKGQVVDIRISLGGVVGDVTGKTRNVVVGQQIALSASVPGGTTTNPSWSIQGTPGQGGTYVGGYSNGLGLPANANWAQVDPVTTNQPSVVYYYTAAGSSTATYSIMVNGNPYSRHTTLMSWPQVARRSPRPL